MAEKYLLGFDIGSSSVKAALLDINTGKQVASAFSPSNEMSINSVQPGFAEQDPDMWWKELVNAVALLRTKVPYQKDEVAAIGISYQMHGLVCVDKDLKPLRSSIIWCDSRAVETGNKAFEALGSTFCLQQFLNSPGNFTASKLKWVKDNEPEVYNRIYKIMLPGDYIAMKLTGEPSTTISGLSEGILWNFNRSDTATEILEHYGIDSSLLSPVVPTFGEQGTVQQSVSDILHLRAGIPVSFRSGDQPNNAYSLNVLQPGEIAATAGTSGVVYGITDKVTYDPKSRVNTFVHVNHRDDAPRYGVLLCINGTGSLNSWLRREVFCDLSYNEMNAKAATIPVGSEGLMCYPFGNGAERVLENKDPGAVIKGLQFYRHNQSHMIRAAQEGIVFALYYGMSVMNQMGMNMHTVRAGHANMFLSEVFAQTFANTSQCVVELYNTDGALGAARAAGVGAGVYKNFNESFIGMDIVKRIEPDPSLSGQTHSAYNRWKNHLSSILS